MSLSERPMRVLPSTGCRLILLLAVLLGMAGCATSEYKYTTTISTGERLSFRLMNGRVEDAVADGIEARTPVVLPNPEQKKVKFVFGVAAKPGDSLRRVVVEDVTDETPVLLVEDEKPELKDQIWSGGTDWLDLDDTAAHWISYLGESFRVYRITVTKSNGQSVVLHEGSVTPAFAKGFLRRMMGKDY